jgi:hypothetical protein
MWAFAIYMVFSTVLMIFFIIDMEVEFAFLPIIAYVSIGVFVVTIALH